MREVEFRHIRANQKLKWFVECDCDMNVKNPGSELQDICVNGKVVNLSRGVGGDSSFFVYRYNQSSQAYNVIAHICF